MTPRDRISKFFTYGEAIASATADRLEIDNTPDAAAIERIILTAQAMDRVRDYLGVPVFVTSWYRCPELNRAIGSKPTSQHIRGEAVDFVAPAFGPATDVVNALLRSGIAYDQCILEFPGRPGGGWTHCSFTETPRRQALLIDASGTMALA